MLTFSERRCTGESIFKGYKGKPSWSDNNPLTTL